MPLSEPVVIIGAGIVGLCLANGLKQARIPFEIYERDETIDSRGQGWAITIHWALPHLQKLLPPEVYAAVLETEVDPAVGRNDTGNFLFINLATLDAKFKIPPSSRRRINREKMRRALYDGVKDHVRWSKRLSNIEALGAGVSASFEDGSKANGSMLVGAEGSNSKTRKFLRPDSYKNHQLPIRFLGVSIDLTHDKVRPLRDLDPLLFQGSHPDTGVFLWVSMLEVPETNGTRGKEEEYYRVQINLSWQLGGPGDEIRSDSSERLEQMKQKAIGFHPILKAVIDGIPHGTEVLEIKLADWPCEDWDNKAGITLVGDAAHAMTMYRGEAANHGILDAYELLEQLKAAHQGSKSLQVALDQYEASMRDRTQTAVLLSRQACFDAHNFKELNQNSAVLKRRAIAVV